MNDHSVEIHFGQHKFNSKETARMTDVEKSTKILKWQKLAISTIFASLR
jgi:hypothetical protein